MIALWIILGVLALILVLLLLPAGIAVSYRNGTLTAEGRWLFLHFTLWPLPERDKAEKEQKPKGKSEAAPKKKKTGEKRPFMDWLQLINDLLPLLGEALQKNAGGHHPEAVPHYHDGGRRGRRTDGDPVWAGQCAAVHRLCLFGAEHQGEGVSGGHPAGLSIRAGGRGGGR